jgi:hypothetical protein
VPIRQRKQVQNLCWYRCKHGAQHLKSVPVISLRTVVLSPPTSGYRVAWTSPPITWHVHSWCSTRHMRLNLRTNLQNPKGFPYLCRNSGSFVVVTKGKYGIWKCYFSLQVCATR